MAERRRKRRFARRIQVRYWLEGEDQERTSYTTNVSISGAFLATNAPHPPNTRMRIEFSGENGFIVEAVVTHAARVSRSLQSIRASGMGIRFLTPPELVREMLPPTAEEFETIEEDDPADLNLREARPGTSHQPADRASDGGRPVYTVSFRNVGYLLNAIEEEIRYGGVFVTTDSAAALQQEVRIALALPTPINRTIYAEAIVVTASDGSGDAAKGMGVALKDTQTVLDELQELIDAARPSGDSG